MKIWLRFRIPAGDGIGQSRSSQQVLQALAAAIGFWL
jgi:hypothetical protein